MAKTRRDFTPESKREAVALLESSGRPQMQITAELGIQPSMLRQWWATLNGASPRPRPTGSTGISPPRPVASPSDQAAELDRTRMERDVPEKPSASSRRCPSDLRLHRAACADLAGASHVPRARSLTQRLLRLAVTARERPLSLQPPIPGRCPAHPCGPPPALRFPHVHAALRAERRSVSRGRVERLIRRHGIRALASRRFRPCTTDSRHDLPIAPNLLRQNFSAARPNTIWLAEPKVRAATSPTCRPARAGCTWPQSSIWPRARSSAGRCAITCAPS